MEELSIFVDESGRFQHPDPSSRFYIIGMVFHDQASDISPLVADLARAEAEIGIEDHCFHAGPLIRKEKCYEILSRAFRGRILSRMMAFASRVDFKYKCLSVDKKFIDSAEQIVDHHNKRSLLIAAVYYFTQVFVSRQADVRREEEYYDKPDDTYLLRFFHFPF